MRIGYSSCRERAQKLNETCDSVTLITPEKNDKTRFLNFVEENSGNTIVIYSIYDLGLQLTQLMPALTRIRASKQDIEIVDKGMFKNMTESYILEVFFECAQNEMNIVRDRAKKGLIKARSRGVKSGRPTINRDIVDRIKFMYCNEKRTIREIAAMCNVSVGTAYKYATMSQE